MSDKPQPVTAARPPAPAPSRRAHTPLAQAAAAAQRVLDVPARPGPVTFDSAL